MQHPPLSAAIAPLLVLGLAADAEARQDSGGFQLADVPTDLPGHDRAPTRRVAPQEPKAQSPTPKSEANGETTLNDWFGGNPIWEWEYATGDWNGARTRLEDRGLSIQASYTREWSSVLAGGISRQSTTRALFDVNATLDFQKMLGWDGATLFVDFYSISGESVSEDAGDFQGLSNLENDAVRDQIGELWLEQVLLDGKLRFKVGKVEANSEFAFVDAAADFINSSAGFTPTIFTFPSYPDPSTAIVVQAFPDERLSLSLGLFDGSAAVDGVPTGHRGPSTFFDDDRSDDYFLIGEAGYTWTLGETRDGRIAGGAWHHTGEFTTFDDQDQSGTTGFYAVVEQRLTNRENSDDGGWYTFAQLGWADPDVSDAEYFAGAGLTTQGTFPGRDDDAAGAYLSWVGLSDEAGYSDNELALELFYRWQLTPWASVKPDLQVIVNPGGDSDVDNAVVGSIRVEIAF